MAKSRDAYAQQSDGDGNTMKKPAALIDQYRVGCNPMLSQTMQI